MINFEALARSALNWQDAQPFPHLIVDNFIQLDLAKQLEADFPSFESDIWQKYSNAIEEKKLSNIWNHFPETTYRFFDYLNSDSFVKKLSRILFNGDVLFSDPGLNGGGWHVHKTGGKLNTHLDYSIHPKLKKQRKINIIIYMNSEWEPEWGGHLGLWGNESAEKPGALVKQIEPVFNRAVIFDTTCNSWHGLPDPLMSPDGQLRKSLAIYYLCEPPEYVDQRGKALFAPTQEQANDEKVLELIKKRSSVESASDVYEK